MNWRASIAAGLLAVLSTTADAGRINLRWDPVDGAVAYKVSIVPMTPDPDCITKDFDAGEVRTYVTPATMQSVHGMPNCQDMCLAVKAINEQGIDSLLWSEPIGGWGRPVLLFTQPFHLQRGMTYTDVPLNVSNVSPGVTIAIQGASGVTFENVQSSGCYWVHADIVVNASAVLGLHDATVTNSDGVFGMSLDAFEVSDDPPPPPGRVVNVMRTDKF
jgi:hypothetical protein